MILTVIVEMPEDRTIESWCDRARSAVVELLAAMPPGYPYADQVVGRVTAERPDLVACEFVTDGRSGKDRCPHPSHSDPRAGKAGRCPACGAVIGGET